MTTEDQINTWLTAFSHALEQRDVEQVTSLFHEDCYWRDLVAFTWNIITLEGQDAIRGMLEARLDDTAPANWVVEGGLRDYEGHAEARFTFETARGRGRGIVRVRDGKCWTLLTTLDELKGHEERIGRRRAQGVEHGIVRGRKSWLDLRNEEAAALGHTVQPYCVIIGGGQGGIVLGARLRKLGVPTIILEKNPRAGDTWRQRYRSLVLHDPVWYDHLPYIPFPDDWPVFTPKDKFGDWLEMYARVMELNYWAGTECTGVRYDESSETWHVTAVRDGKEIVLTPKQLVVATGAYGPPRLPDLPGAEMYKGRLIHSSEYRDGSDHKGVKAVVVGTGSSAHDIAADLWDHGGDVTMIQRSPAVIARSETLMRENFGPHYSEEAVDAGITTDIGDLMTASMPLAPAADIHRRLYKRIAEIDADYYQRLTDAGYLWNFGEDDTGLMMRALRTASGYYIDVGAAELICRGDVAMRSGVALAGLSAEGAVLSDGSEIAADLVVCATGYQTMDEMVAQLISRDVADRLGPCWGIGSGIPGDPGPWRGELRNLWKPTAVPGLWIHGGNLFMTRFYSRYLSLQIKARMEGMDPSVHGEPDGR